MKNVARSLDPLFFLLQLCVITSNTAAPGQPFVFIVALTRKMKNDTKRSRKKWLPRSVTCQTCCLKLKRSNIAKMAKIHKTLFADMLGRRLFGRNQGNTLIN